MFGSRANRVGWAAIGLLALGAGYRIAAPSFRSTPAAPSPWGLWLGTNSRYEGPEAGISLRLKIDAAKGCEGPVAIYGELSWSDVTRVSSHFAGHRPPTRFALSVANAQVLGASVRDPEAGAWRPMKVNQFRKDYVITGRIGQRGSLADRVDFRLSLAIAHPAGYGACYLTSPALFEFKGDEPSWQSASSIANIALEQRARRGRRPIREIPLDDAVMWMEMAGREPDRTVLDAGAQVRRGRVLLTCTALLPEPGRRFATDPSFYERRLLEESSCGSVQRFRVPDAQDSLNLRLFLAGILVSAGVAMLLEALVTGRTMQPH